MALNAPIGNNYLEGSIGVGRIEFNGIDLGKTVGDIEFEKVEDIKDIMYAQDGTQYFDKVPTGISYSAKITLGEVTVDLLDRIDDHSDKTPGGTGLILGKSIYRSLRDNAVPTIIKRVDSRGNSSTNPIYWLTLPLTFITTSGIPVLGPDAQRTVEANLIVFYDTDNNLFGYTGLDSCAGVT